MIQIANCDYLIIILHVGASLQLCAWLLENEGSFKPRITDEDCTGALTSKETVRAYVQGEIVSYLRVPASTGESEVIQSLYLLVWCVYILRLFIFSQVRPRGYLTPERPIGWPELFCCVWTWRGVNLGQRSATPWSRFYHHCWRPWAESAPISTCLCVRVTRACSWCSDCSSSEKSQGVNRTERSKVCKDSAELLSELFYLIFLFTEQIIEPVLPNYYLVLYCITYVLVNVTFTSVFDGERSAYFIFFFHLLVTFMISD